MSSQSADCAEQQPLSLRWAGLWTTEGNLLPKRHGRHMGPVTKKLYDTPATGIQMGTIEALLRDGSAKSYNII